MNKYATLDPVMGEGFQFISEIPLSSDIDLTFQLRDWSSYALKLSPPKQVLVVCAWYKPRSDLVDVFTRLKIITSTW